jgi:hypothetical protein
MRSHYFGTSLVLATSLAAIAVACGSSSPSKTNPDSKVFEDGSSKPIDGSSGSSGITGLGQACGSGSACPSTASMCVSIALSSTMTSTSYCTPTCDTGASAMTNGSGQFPGSASSYTPPSNVADCTSAYSGGGSGTPVCGLILSYTPMTNPPAANTTYTAISLGCAVECGTGNTCPTGMTCNTTAMLCFPNT